MEQIYNGTHGEHLLESTVQSFKYPSVCILKITIWRTIISVNCYIEAWEVAGKEKGPNGVSFKLSKSDQESGRGRGKKGEERDRSLDI